METAKRYLSPNKLHAEKAEETTAKAVVFLFRYLIFSRLILAGKYGSYRSWRHAGCRYARRVRGTRTIDCTHSA